MTKADFIKAIAEQHQDLSKSKVESILDSVFDTISANLDDGEKVTWAGFGSFETSKRAARQGRNPQTGEALQIPASTHVSFKIGKKLKDYLNR